MSLTDNSLASYIQESVRADLKDRRERKICLKCGVEEHCTIDKILDKDGHTVKQYYIRSSYRYIEGTLKDEHFYDICKDCGDKLTNGHPIKKLTNRPEVEAVFENIKTGLGHELFMLTSNNKENKESIPSIRRKRTQLVLHKQVVDDRYDKGLPLDKEQKTLKVEFNNLLAQVEKQLQFAENREAKLMVDIDTMISTGD